MFYRQRELRRLWRLEIYDGDPDDPNTPTREETIVAFSAVDANRHGNGKLTKEPEALFFVTWPDQAGQMFRINNTTEGPVGDPIVPSILTNITSADDWDF